MASLWKKNKTRFEISAFQRIRTSITFHYRWLVWQPQHDLCHIIISWTKQAIYVEKSLTITLKMVIGLFFNSIFDVLVTTLHVMWMLSSAFWPAQNVFRAEFLGSEPQTILPYVFVMCFLALIEIDTSRMKWLTCGWEAHQGCWCNWIDPSTSDTWKPIAAENESKDGEVLEVNRLIVCLANQIKRFWSTNKSFV